MSGKEIDVDEIIQMGNTISKGSTFLLSDKKTPVQIPYWIPTGIYPLDVAISGIKNGGLPGGSIIEIIGLEATGKTMLAALAIKNAMKQGIKGIFIDTEAGVSLDFFRMLGIEDMVYVQLDTVSKIGDYMERMIMKLKEKDSKNKILIVWDSIAQTTTEEEVAGDYSDQLIAMKARRLSKLFRKIVTPFNQYGVTLLLTNQYRQNIGIGMFGPKYTTPGGMAVPYVSDLIVALKIKKTIKSSESGEKIGAKIRAETIKSRITVPHRIVDFNLYYNKGIDNKGAMFEYLKNKGFIEVKGPWKKFTLNGKDYSFQKEIDWYKFYKEDKKFSESIKDKVFEYSKYIEGMPGEEISGTKEEEIK